ncbi:hypothetical protein JR316_0011199 [Psilocybe cubensis]|uniref:Uncharacterized protein n=1 Tax=Psilocybe cubensis TaxID=181762 RepID=A0ACB8GJ68_PSICU|nr:hypothetical protein JR316_0011199 [Psilocybe cubensis]KAH9475644.1 hypothetical protein JR316_0011199 [Psilocybe cubensis]
MAPVLPEPKVATVSQIVADAAKVIDIKDPVWDTTQLYMAYGQLISAVHQMGPWIALGGPGLLPFQDAVNLFFRIRTLFHKVINSGVSNAPITPPECGTVRHICRDIQHARQSPQTGPVAGLITASDSADTNKPNKPKRGRASKQPKSKPYIDSEASGLLAMSIDDTGPPLLVVSDNGNPSSSTSPAGPPAVPGPAEPPTPHVSSPDQPLPFALTPSTSMQDAFPTSVSAQTAPPNPSDTNKPREVALLSYEEVGVSPNDNQYRKAQHFLKRPRVELPPDPHPEKPFSVSVAESNLRKLRAEEASLQFEIAHARQVLDVCQREIARQSQQLARPQLPAPHH